MRRSSSVGGTAQHYTAGVATFALAPLLGPFAFLAYPLFLGLAKKGIAEEMDQVDLEGDLEIGKTWEEARPWETFCEVSTTRDVGGLLPLTITRKHKFTRDHQPDLPLSLPSFNSSDDDVARDVVEDDDDDDKVFGSLSPESQRLVLMVKKTLRDTERFLR